MPTQTPTPPVETAPRTLVGWQGIRFTLPPDWNVTGFSMDPVEGYLKVDSPGTMFVQVKWTDPRRKKRPRTLGEIAFQWWKSRRKKGTPTEEKPPDLRSMLDAFLEATRKQAKKAKTSFDCKVKPEVKEANGRRTALHFSWTGGGNGQGKIWHCADCGRVVIAQVVGQGRENIGNIAAEMFDGMRDHAEEGYTTWALFDLVAGIPEDFALKTQKLMSGYLKLEFARKGGERITLERWGLAKIALKKFTLAEWFENACSVRDQKVTLEDAQAQGHTAVRAVGAIRGPLAWLQTLRAAGLSLKPASRYEGCAWECPESNRLYAVQVWHKKQTENLLTETVTRCECH